MLIEAIYLLDTPNDMALHSKRYLPTTTIRVLADEHGRDHCEHLDENIIKSVQHYVDRKTAGKIVKLKEESLRNALAYGDRFADKKSPKIIAESHAAAKSQLQHEIDRLQALKQVNPNIRQDEVDYFNLQNEAIDRLLDEAKPRLDAIRVIVTM